MTLTGRAGMAALVGVLVVLIVPRVVTIVVIVVVLAVGVLVDLALAASVRALRLSRSGDDLVRLGETATVRLTVANPGGRPLRATLRDAWEPSAVAAPRRVTLAVPSGGARKVTTALTPTRRGDRAAHRVTVRSAGPLGLAARQGSHTVPWAVRVLPPFTSRRHLPAKLSRLRELDGRQRSLVRGQGTEFDSLREYVAGDDVRSIDWRATARRETVVVRTWRPERDRRVVLVLDTGRTSAGRVGDIPRLDASMDACLLLAALASRAGDRVDLLAFDRRVRARVRGATRSDLLASMVRAMAPLEPELVESDGAAMIGAILGETRRRSLVVLLTDLNPAAMAYGLLPRLPALTSRHQVVVAAVADPKLTEMSRARGDADSVYTAAAAERTLADRRRLTADLRAHGAEVLDAAPDHLPPALADTYLSLKAAGRL
jgi:uncharacterized protein (DUF58 family)